MKRTVQALVIIGMIAFQGSMHASALRTAQEQAEILKKAREAGLKAKKVIQARFGITEPIPEGNTLAQEASGTAVRVAITAVQAGETEQNAIHLGVNAAVAMVDKKREADSSFVEKELNERIARLGLDPFSKVVIISEAVAVIDIAYMDLDQALIDQAVTHAMAEGMKQLHEIEEKRKKTATAPERTMGKIDAWPYSLGAMLPPPAQERDALALERKRADEPAKAPSQCVAGAGSGAAVASFTARELDEMVRKDIKDLLKRERRGSLSLYKEYAIIDAASSAAYQAWSDDTVFGRPTNSEIPYMAAARKAAREELAKP